MYRALCPSHGVVEIIWGGKLYLVCPKCFAAKVVTICERVK